MELKPGLSVPADELGRWAASHSRILRLWIYGKCLEDTGRKDAHLDVAFEVVEIPKDERMTFVTRVVKEWEQELARRVRIPVHLQPTAMRGIPDGARIVYERESYDRRRVETQTYERQTET